MRFYTVLQGRPQYYDRNAVASNIVYNAGAIGPHGTTTRATYTVPTGRKAYFESGFSNLFRSIAAGTAGQVFARTAYTPNGGSTMYVAYADFYVTTIGTIDHVGVGSVGLMIAGDVAQLQTADAAVGGTVDYNLGVKYTEFDA